MIFLSLSELSLVERETGGQRVRKQVFNFILILYQNRPPAASRAARPAPSAGLFFFVAANGGAAVPGRQACSPRSGAGREVAHEPGDHGQGDGGGQDDPAPSGVAVEEAGSRQGKDRQVKYHRFGSRYVTSSYSAVSARIPASFNSARMRRKSSRRCTPTRCRCSPSVRELSRAAFSSRQRSMNRSAS